jgi:hypothetical protein
LIGENGVTLSGNFIFVLFNLMKMVFGKLGGQKARLALARAVYQVTE